MDEKETTKGSEKEVTTETEDTGSKFETTPIIERAREEREKMEIANKKKEELLDREERIMAKRELGGMSEAGQTPVKKEETDKEYSDRIDQEIRDGKYNG